LKVDLRPGGFGARVIVGFDMAVHLLEQGQLMRQRGADKVAAAAGGTFKVASDLANAERDPLSWLVEFGFL
jgi:hypothetical protein